MPEVSKPVDPRAANGSPPRKATRKTVRAPEGPLRDDRPKLPSAREQTLPTLQRVQEALAPLAELTDERGRPLLNVPLAVERGLTTLEGIFDTDAPPQLDKSTKATCQKLRGKLRDLTETALTQERAAHAEFVGQLESWAPGKPKAGFRKAVATALDAVRKDDLDNIGLPGVVQLLEDYPDAREAFRAYERNFLALEKAREARGVFGSLECQIGAVVLLKLESEILDLRPSDVPCECNEMELLTAFQSRVASLRHKLENGAYPTTSYIRIANFMNQHFNREAFKASRVGEIVKGVNEVRAFLKDYLVPKGK